MKLHHIALAVLTAVAGHAAQAAPSVNVNDAATVKIYLSGASALRAAVAGIMLNDICGGSAANATTTLYNVAESGSGFSFGGNYWGITCRLPAAKLGLAANTPVAFFKSDNGGSAQGVFPVFYQTARPFVDAAPANCTTTTTVDRVYTGCTNNTLAIPQFGVSDVEPGLFKGANVPKDRVRRGRERRAVRRDVRQAEPGRQVLQHRRRLHHRVDRRELHAHHRLRRSTHLLPGQRHQLASAGQQQRHQAEQPGERLPPCGRLWHASRRQRGAAGRGLLAHRHRSGGLHQLDLGRP
jgi:hypothetical protein